MQALYVLAETDLNDPKWIMILRTKAGIRYHETAITSLGHDYQLLRC